MRVIAFLLMMLVAPGAMTASLTSWKELKDPVATQFEDPFAALSMSELRSLGAVLRLRKRLSEGGIAAEARATMAHRLGNEEAKLAAAGIDIDWLLSQRETIARNRVEAALAGNPAVISKDITITGYVIPIIGQDGIARSGYLVPEYGMCSHVPAPDPNQMIRYRLATDWQAEQIYQRVVLSGRLELNVSRQTINLLDGQVEMIAAFDMQVTGVQPLEKPDGGAEQRTIRSYPAHQ